MHENLRPYMCDLCGRSFTNNAGLKEHSISHKIEKNFFCEKCNKG